MSCLLLASLWLFARLIAPAVAMPAPVSVADAVALQALQTLCHSAAQNDPGGSAPAHAPPHHDCLLCPACHVLALAAAVTPGGPALRPPAQRLIGLAAALPASTGPPAQPRLVAQPTGPPSLSV